MKCGQPLRTSPGLLVAGQSASSAISPSSQAKTHRVVQPGGFFPRLIAIIIDALILGVVAVPIIYLFLAQTTPTGQSNAALDPLRWLRGPGSQYTPEQLTQLAQLFAGIAILLLFYYVGTWSILGGSPGQLVMSLRIVDDSAKTVGFGRALLRYFMKGFFGFLWPVSALMVAFGKDKRAIHDFLAGTYVIQFLDPKLEDLDSVLPPGPAAPLPPGPTPPPVTSPVPQEMYAGTALAATAVSGPAPAAAPESPAAPAPAPPMAPAAPDQSAFERYASPGEPPPKPTSAPAPDLPIFPTSDPGGYQPMAPAPAPTDPGSGAPRDQLPTQPYALPFTPQAPPPSGSAPDATPPAQPPTA